MSARTTILTDQGIITRHHQLEYISDMVLELQRIAVQSDALELAHALAVAYSEAMRTQRAAASEKIVVSRGR